MSIAQAARPEQAKASSTVKVTGYLQTQFTDVRDSNDDGTDANAAFSIRRMRIRLGGEVRPGVGYTVMFDPATPSNILRDFYVSLRLIPKHELRIGQQKTQFGYENPESSARLLTINRAFASEALGRGPDLRDLGLGLLGDWSLPGGIRVDYALTLVNGSGPNQVQDETSRKNFWGRGGVTVPIPVADTKLRVGGSYGNGNHLRKMGMGATASSVVFDFHRIGIDVQLDTRWLWVAGEHLRGTDKSGGESIRAHGEYLTVVGRSPWNLGPIVRLERFNPDRAIRGDTQQRYTFGAYFDIVPVAARLILNVERDDSSVRRDDVVYAFVQVVF